jgi:hypothetical protein
LENKYERLQEDQKLVEESRKRLLQMRKKREKSEDKSE